MSIRLLKHIRGKRARTTARSQLSPKKLELQQRRAKAVRLRLIGHTFEKIGEALGVDPSTAFGYVCQARTEMIREPTMALLELELDRLDVLLAACFAKAAQGNFPAIETALSVLAKRYFLLGLGKTRADVRVGGDKANPLRTVQELDLSKLTDDQLLALSSALEALAPVPVAAIEDATEH